MTVSKWFLLLERFLHIHPSKNRNSIFVVLCVSYSFSATEADMHMIWTLKDRKIAKAWEEKDNKKKKLLYL